MSTLIISKESLKTWKHTDSILGVFIISKFYFNATNLTFQIVEQGQSKRVIYNIEDITLYDTVNGGGAETFGNTTELSLRLEELNYPAFQYDGQIVSIANLLQAGTNVTITGDGTEASPYVINATGDGSSSRTIKTVETATYDFINSDKSKYIIFQGSTEDITVTLDGADFTAGDVLTGVSAVDGFNLILDNPDGIINPSASTGFTLNLLDVFELTCLDTSSWILTITRYNSSGGIETITGDYVDNTDPLNPIVNTPPLNGVLNAGNGTNGIDIFITDGDSVLLDNGSKLKQGSFNNASGGGISRICAVDKEDQWEDGVRYLRTVGGANIYAETMNNVIPDNTYDSTKGWAVNSIFNNLVTGTTYKCTGASVGTAVWEEYSILQSQIDLKENLSDKGRLSSDYTLSNINTAQKLFNIGSSGNGSFNAEATTLYEYELFVNFTGLSAVSGFFSHSLAGTATFTDLQLDVFATKAALISGSVFQGVITSASAFQCTTSNANTAGTLKIRGLVNVNGAGTITPTITLSQASSAVVKKNSYFSFRKIGTSSFTATTNII